MFRPYACRMCGATSYRPVIDRDADGALRPTGLFHCSGCSVVFTDPKAWRDGQVELPSHASPAGKSRTTPVTARPASAAASPAAPDFGTCGATASTTPSPAVVVEPSTDDA